LVILLFVVFLSFLHFLMLLHLLLLVRPHLPLLRSLRLPPSMVAPCVLPDASGLSPARTKLKGASRAVISY
jgi:hypothetical protein